MASMAPSGPPYASNTAQVGGRPSIIPDVPPLAVFIALYVTFAAINMTIFQINRRRGIKFIPSAALFGFCMSRIVTCSLRIAWAVHPSNVRLAIASNIFVNAGILIVYVLNIIFAQRILRSLQPKLGWNRVLRLFFKVLYLTIFFAIVMVIVVLVLSVYTLDPHIKQQARDVQLTGITYLFLITLIPVVLLAFAHLSPKSHDREHFGHGSMRTKMIVLLASTCLCITIAGFKVGTLWMPPRSARDPAWYQSKAAFYVFNFTLEIVILSILTPARIDKRFHVPNGSDGPGDYTRKAQQPTKVVESNMSTLDAFADVEGSSASHSDGRKQEEKKP